MSSFLPARAQDISSAKNIILKLQNGEICAKDLCDLDIISLLAVWDSIDGPEVLGAAYTKQEIAKILNITPAKVTKRCNQIKKHRGHTVACWDIDDICEVISSAYKYAISEAHKANDYKALWAITKEKVNLLQSLGIIQQAPKRVELAVGVVDLLRNEHTRELVDQLCDSLEDDDTDPLPD